MPKNSQIIIFDDSPVIVDIYKTLLTYEGHRVVGAAGSIQELKINLPGWRQIMHPTQPIVALIDDNAPWMPGESPDALGVGRLAEEMIKEIIPEAITVATTTAGHMEAGYGDHYYYPEIVEVSLEVFVTQLPDTHLPSKERR